MANKNENKKLPEVKEFTSSIIWLHVVHHAIVYSIGPIGFYYLITERVKFLTYIWTFLATFFGGWGSGAGAHRLFSHRSFKVIQPLKLFFIICQSMTGMSSIIYWCQVHRVHHKYTDTSRDPSNINGGFLFAHIYWLFRFNPECAEAINEVDVSDLKSDKDLMLQHKYYKAFFMFFCIILPSLIPYYLWNESLFIAVMANMFRWLMNVSQIAVSNSFMHMYGARRYDKSISAAENLFCVLFTNGEGYHNFHHIFPFDYRGQDPADLISFNLTTFYLNVLKKLGWIYDCKTVSQAMIERRRKRTGDGMDYLSLEESRKNPVWGFGDSDMNEEDRNELFAMVN